MLNPVDDITQHLRWRSGVPGAEGEEEAYDPALGLSDVVVVPQHLKCSMPEAFALGMANPEYRGAMLIMAYLAQEEAYRSAHRLH